MEWYVIIFVIIIGISVGFINTLAGSGSVITLPLLIFLGLPATVANGTNRVAIFMQNVVGVSSFHQKKKLDIKGGAIPIIATVLGSVIGSNIAIDIHNEYLEKVIGVGMIIMFFVIIWQPKRWITQQHITQQPKWYIQMPLYFLIGIYGGLIQLGTGIFLLSTLVLQSGYDLVKANALKLFIILIYSPFVLYFFMINDQIWWKYGLILGIGNMTGSFLATKFAIHWDVKYIRYLLLTMIVVSVLKLFGIFSLIF